MRDVDMFINDKSCRVLKLKSGDEIIAKVKGKEKGHFLVERPMQIKTSIMHDEYGRVTNEVLLLRSWLANTNQMVCKIPEDFVALMLPPAKPVINHYKVELEKEDTFLNVVNKIDPTGEQDLSDIDAMLKEYFENLRENPEAMNDMLNPQQQAMPGAVPPFKHKRDEETPEETFIVMQFAIPKEDFFELLDQTDMQIPDELIDEMMKEKRDKNSPDWGNRWTDWPKDVEDLFDDDDWNSPA